LPFNPTAFMIRSRTNTARAIYPVSSKKAIKKNKRKIWGKKTTTFPTPPMTPSTTRLWSAPAGNNSLAPCAAYSTPWEIHSIGICAHEKID